MIFACWNSGKTVDNKMRSHCGKRLFSVQKLRFTVVFSIEVSDMGRCRSSKKSDEFSKNTVTH